jgi:hypothetical protein
MLQLYKENDNVCIAYSSFYSISSIVTSNEILL